MIVHGSWLARASLHGKLAFVMTLIMQDRGDTFIIYLFTSILILAKTEYIRDIRDIRSSNQIRSNTEIQSLNMFESDILNIRKVRFRSNIQCFEFFGQPT